MAATVDDLPSFLKRTLLADSVLEASSSGPSVAHLTEEACDRDERDNMRNEKHTRSPPSHPPYIDMVLDAIKVLKGRRGTSRQKIERYILENFIVKPTSVRKQLNLALKRGVAKGLLLQVRGSGGCGSFKINKELCSYRKPLSLKITPQSQSHKQKQPAPPTLADAKENVPVSNTGSCARQARAARKNALARIRHQLDGSLDQELKGVITHMEKEGQARKRNTKKAEKRDDPDYPASDSEQSVASTSSDSEDEDPNAGLCEYERQRLRNIEENRAFMASLNLKGAKEDFSAVRKKPRREKKELESFMPSRKSLRLQRLDPNGLPLPPPRPKKVEPGLPARKHEGPLRMECTNTTERSLEAAFQASIVKSLKLKVRNGLNGDIIEENSTHSSNVHVPSASTADDVAHLYSQLSFSKVARLFPCGHRLHCFQFHPTSEKNLAAAGSRYGTLALWDMDSDPGDRVYHYEPHSDIIDDMAFPRFSSDPFLYTCSHDGTVRRTDFERGIFDEVYSTSDEDMALTSCDLTNSSDWLLVGRKDGAVMLLDVRAGKWPKCFWKLHGQSIKTVHLHPTDNKYFATASRDGAAALWDFRCISDHKSTIQKICFDRSISSAFFSPLTGKKLLVTSLDNSIRVYQSLYNPILSVSKMAWAMTVSHNNHNIALQAQWDPTENYFTIGAPLMRQVDIFGVQSPLNITCHTLAGDQVDSSCSIATFHPRRRLVGGASFSGKAYLWAHSEQLPEQS